MKKRKLLAACLAAVQLVTLSVGTLPAAAETAADTVFAQKSSENPGFSYGSKAQDWVEGQEYYMLENQYVKTLIGTTKVKNDQKGPMSNGAIMDAVSKTSNRENLDWTQFIMRPQMTASWNTAGTDDVVDLNSLEVVGNTVVGTGAYNKNPAIQSEVTYSIVENTPLVKMEVKLTNTGAEDYQGYFEYLVDPDESGEQHTYVPGVGWTVKNSSTVLTGGEWTDNYIFEGCSNAYSGYTAHAILWDEDEPTGLVNDSYIFGAWFDASVAAGQSKTITFYHLPHDPGGTASPYSEAAFWAKVVRGEADPADYGMVNGTVTDLDGSPIKGADIVCQYAVGEKQGQTAATASTDKNGSYQMRVEKDVYTLTATIPGYTQGSQSVDLNTMDDPRADIILDSFSGVRVTKDTSLQSLGGIPECKPGDYVLENNLFALAIADGTNDGQLGASTAGRILDAAATGRTDTMDWIFTSWISDVQPHLQKSESGILPGDSWSQLDTRFDHIEVVSETASEVVLKATGVYHHDLAVAPDAQEAVVEQVITMRAGQSYAEIQTTIKNTSGEELSLYVGDAMDVDVSTQKSYAPGIGDITQNYNSPIDQKPSQPWLSQYSSSQQEIYSFLYEEDFDVNVFGNTNWLMGYRPVTLAADGSFTYSRQLVVLDTEGYAQAPDAMQAYYGAYAYGVNASMEVYDGKIARGQIFNAEVAVTNSSEQALENVKVTLDTPYQMMSAGESEIVIPSIAPGATETAAFSVLALEGGRGMLKSRVEAADGVELSFSQAISISGQGYYAGDDHTHSKNSDGSGTIRQNVDSAYESKLLNWLYSTDHNKITQKAETITETNRLDGNFVSITGTEITSSGKGHALAYGVSEFVPEYRIGQTINGEVWTWQDTIDQVNNAGGIFYVAHPNYPGLKFSEPYDIRNYAGIEVWNGFYHALDPDMNVNTFAFDYWDKVNCRGEQKFFGIANSDGHNSGKMGDPYIKSELTELTYENIQSILASGQYYGSNGPEIRYNIEGVGMAETLNITESKAVDFNITAFDPNYALTSVKLIKNVVTGSVDGIANKEVVFEEDFSGQDIHEYQKTLSLTVSPNEFYRIEVVSEGGTTGNGGKGQGQGLGFAFSNPIWIGQAEQSNAKDLKEVSYNGSGTDIVVTEANDMVIRTVQGSFDLENLQVTVSEGAAAELKLNPAQEGALSSPRSVDIVITAEDGSQATKTLYLLEEKAAYSVQAPEKATAGETFSFTANTPDDVTGIALFNEYGLKVGLKEITRTDNGDGTVTWSGKAAIGTVGKGRTLTLAVANAQGKYTLTEASFTLDIAAVTPKTYSASIEETGVVNVPVTLTVVTDTSVTKLALQNEYGMTMSVLNASYQDSDEGRVWTAQIKIGTKGVRTFTVYGKNKFGDLSDPVSTNTITVRYF